MRPRSPPVKKDKQNKGSFRSSTRYRSFSINLFHGFSTIIILGLITSDSIDDFQDTLDTKSTSGSMGVFELVKAEMLV